MLHTAHDAAACGDEIVEGFQKFDFVPYGDEPKLRKVRKALDGAYPKRWDLMDV